MVIERVSPVLGPRLQQTAQMVAAGGVLAFLSWPVGRYMGSLGLWVEQAVRYFR